MHVETMTKYIIKAHTVEYYTAITQNEGDLHALTQVCTYDISETKKEDFQQFA